MIKEVECKNIITKSQLPGADFVVNPFIGCLHNCTYCYACFMKRFTGHREDWGSFVDVKKDIGLKTAKEIKKIPPGSTILLSSVTDPYQPIERKYRATRAFLENVLDNDVNISILTKSSLVERDIDLLKKLKSVQIGLSFSSHDDKIRRIFEPGTSSVENKIQTLSRLNLEGLLTYAFLGPILPGITNLEELFKIFKEVNVDLVMVENLNMNGSIFNSINVVIKENFPNLAILYSKIKTNPKPYWSPIREEVELLAKKYELPIKIYFDH